MATNPFDAFDAGTSAPTVDSPDKNPFDSFDAAKPSTFLERQAPVKAASQEAVKGVGAIAKGAEAVSYFVDPTSDFEPGVFVPHEVQQQREAFQKRLQLPRSEQLRQITTGPLYQWGKSLQEAAEETYPLSEEEKKGFTTHIGKAIGGFLPMAATGPLAPATIGVQSIGEGLDANYQKELAKGKTPEQAADSAITKSLATGAVQAAIFSFLPAPLKKTGDKALIDKFGRGVLSRFLLKRVAQAGEGAVLGATSKVSENVIEGEPITKDVGSSAAGLGVMQAFFPRGATPDEQLFKTPPENYFDSAEAAHQANLPFARAADRPVIRDTPDTYVPPEAGPIGNIPPGGTVPVPTRRRIILPSDFTPAKPAAAPADIQTTIAGLSDENDLRALWDAWKDKSDDPRQQSVLKLINDRIENLQSERTANATQTRQEPENIGGKLQGTSAGENVPADASQVRKGESAKADGGDSTQPSAQGKETPPDNVAPVVFKGIQKGAKGIPDMEYYNLTQDIPGFRAGSTLGRKQLEELGYTIPKTEEPGAKGETRPSALKFPLTEVPASQIVARPELMQFKEVQNVDTGENEGEKLTGKWDESKAGLLMLWEPQDPAKYGLKDGQKYIVANGHHRFAFGSRENVPAYGSQIFKESDGYSAQDARRIAAEVNIADGKGTIYDQVKYLRNSPSTRTTDARMEAARRIGNRGGKAVNIAFNAGNDLYAAFVNEKINPDQAQSIALAAPTNEAAQRVGIKFALAGKSMDEVSALTRRALQETGGQAKELDLFGNDDSLMQTMAAEEAKAEEIRAGIREQIRSVQDAANNPKMARKLGVDVKDTASIQKKITGLKAELGRWENWFLTGNEDLQKQIRGKTIETKPEFPKEISGQKVTTDQGLLSGEAERPVRDVTNKGAKSLAKPIDFKLLETAQKAIEAAQTPREIEAAIKKHETDIANSGLGSEGYISCDTATEIMASFLREKGIPHEIVYGPVARGPDKGQTHSYIRIGNERFDATEQGFSLVKNEIVQDVFTPEAVAQITKLKYSIRPNGKYDISANTDFEGAVKSGIGGTLGLENNLTYEQLVSKVGKQIAEAIRDDSGTNKREESGWKHGEFDLTKPPEKAETESLYREASAQDVDAYINPATSARTPFGTPEIYVATDRDLALGQGRSQSGIVVEFNPEGLDVSLPRQKKPGSAFVESQGGGAERIIKAQPEDLRKSVKSITILDSYAKSKEPYMMRLRRFLKDNWNVDKQEGKTVYTPKGEEKPALKLEEPESVEAQKVRLAEEEKARAVETAKQKLSDAVAKPLVGKVGDIGQRSLLPGEEDLFSAAPAKSTQDKPLSEAAKKRANAVVKYDRDLEKAKEQKSVAVDHQPESEDGPEIWNLYSKSKGNDRQATVSQDAKGRFIVENEKGSIIEWEKSSESALEKAKDYINEGESQEQYNAKRDARSEIIHAIDLPPDFKIKDIQDTKWGSVYYLLQKEIGKDADGEPIYEDYKISIRDHEPSPFREKEFGSVDAWFEVPKNPTPKQLGDAVAKVEAWVERKSDAEKPAPIPESGGRSDRPEKPEAKLTESQKKTISAVQKYRIGTNPQTYSLVERLTQSETEKELGEQPVKIKNDKTGEEQTVLEQDLTPVKSRTAEERAASKALTTKQLDDLIRKEGLDPKEFPDKAAKREILKRRGKLSKRDVAEGIAEKLEEKKIKGKSDELFTSLFPGLDPASVRAIWNTALDVAQAAIRAGGTLADGIERAIEYIRSSIRDVQWDEAAVRRELETSIGPLDESARHQVAGVRKLGSEYEPENIKAVQSKLRVGYFDGTQPVEASRTESAWDIANRLTGSGKAAFAEEVSNTTDANMGPVLLVNELWNYAVKMAVGKDDSLLRFIVSRYSDFETIAGGGSTSKAGQVLRSAAELAKNPFWRALVKMEKESADMAGRRLAVGPELFNDIISRVNEINLTPEEIDNVLREGRDSQGRTIQQILDENSVERTAARESLDRYSPQIKSTALETVYEWLKENSGADEKTFVDSLTRALVDLRNVDLDEPTARQIAEGTWTRKNTVETTRRRAAWDRVLKELDERAQRTAQAFVNRLEASQVEWQQNPERKNEALKVIREALDPKTQLPAQTPSLFKIPLRERLMALGVSRETAIRLVNEIYEKRLSEWASARTRAMERAAESGSVKSLIEAMRSSPYRAQKDPAWRQRTAEDWFMSNGLSRDQAVTAAKLFSDQFEKALQTAAEKVAVKLLDGKSPRTVADVIKAIRAGLTDPSRNWVEDIAALNGWKSLTAEQHAQLAEIDSKLSDPELSLPEQSELFDQMNSIVQRAGDGSKRWKYAIGELFAANKLSGLKTFTLHLFQPITASLVRDFPIAAIFQTKDFGTIARGYVEAARNFFPELKYAWQKDIYYLSQSKMISYHNELRNQFEDGIKSLKAGDVKGSLKLTYAWAQYFLRALQSANQANQAIIREWKLSLYGSQAMRDAGMSTGEIARIVDKLVEMKQAAYEDGLDKGMSKNAAYVRADDLAFQQMRQYFGETIPGDTKSIADDIIRSAENDQYSTVGRLSPENTGKEEGWASEFVNKLVLRPASELRKDGGFKSVLGMTLFGFVSIPLRVARYLSNFSPYGFVRYGRYKLGQARNWENPWQQSIATDLQAKQRLREAIVGTAVGTLALGLFHTTADPDRDKRKFGIYVSGAWKGINSRVERDALDKLGFKPLSLHVVVDGKVRSSIPMTRTGHALGYLFGLSSMADDIAWRNKEAAITGKEVPIASDVVSALGTLYYIVGQQGFLQSVSHFQTVAQGSVGGAAIEKSIADAASSLAGGFIPAQVFLQNMTELVKGPLDKSSIESDVAANLPIVGAHWQKQGFNRLGDPLYDQTWYGKSLRLGAPIAFKVAQNKENEQVYGMMVDKGVAPPDLRRYIIEEKYGHLSDDQWSKFSKLSGDLLKQTIIGNLSTLQGEDPADVKKFLNKAGTTANNDAASATGLEAVPKASGASVAPSGGDSAASTSGAASGRSAGPAALRGVPKSTGIKRLRRVTMKSPSRGRTGGIHVAKLRTGGRRVAAGRRITGARIASGYGRKIGKRKIVTV